MSVFEPASDRFSHRSSGIQEGNNVQKQKVTAPKSCLEDIDPGMEKGLRSHRSSAKSFFQKSQSKGIAGFLSSSAVGRSTNVLHFLSRQATVVS